LRSRQGNAAARQGESGCGSTFDAGAARLKACAVL